MTLVNYDLDLLEINATAPGFVIGKGKVGVTDLGPGAATYDLLDVFTSVTVNAQQAVESGLFPHADTTTLGLATWQSDAPDYLDDTTIEVVYDSLTVFRGRVRDWKIDRDVDMGAPNRDYTKYAVGLTATNQAERFAGRTVDVSGLAAGDVATRLTDAISFLDDVQLLDANQRLTDAWRTETFAAGPVDPTVKDALALIREAEALLGAVAIYDVTTPDTLYFRPVGAGDTWTDPAISGDTVQPGDAVTGATVTATQDSDAKVTVQATNRNDRNDANLTVDVPTTVEHLQRIANGLPLTGFGTSAPSSIRLPFRAGLVTDGTLMPTTVVLDGTSYPALGVRHNITPRGWTIEAELGPEYLITREGTYAPHRPTSFGRSGATLTWTASDSEAVTGYRVCARTDRYPRSPADSTLSVDVLGRATATASLTLTTGVWRVSLFALTSDDDIYSYPVTLGLVTVV